MKLRLRITLRLLFMVLTAAGLLTLTAGPAQAAPKFKLKQVVNADQPTVVTSAPGQPRLTYVAERRGKIRIIKNGRLLRGNFLDISRRVKSTWIEQGLLGLAFPPDYAKTRRFYVHYVNRAGHVIIAQYRRRLKKPRRANPASHRVVMRIPQVIEAGGHNGGAMRFLGRSLFFTIGDGNNPGDKHNQAQDLSSLRGKVLRIIPRPGRKTGRRYDIPAANPLIGQPGRNEIFSWGLRNPHAFSFHRPAGGKLHVMITDVGQVRSEEINYVPFNTAKGGNFGWKLYEGNEPYDCGEEQCPNGAPVIDPPTDLIWPALVYDHDAGCAIIGGPVVTDPALPSLRGRIIYGDFCTNRLRHAAPADLITDDRDLGLFMPPGKGRHTAMNGIGTDRWGRVYLFSNFGPIYRLREIR